MLEFGSDFHCVDGFSAEDVRHSWDTPFLFLADGRQAIAILLEEKQWKRIWIPEYFCYEVVDSIRATGIEVAFYEDYPCGDDEAALQTIKFEDGDVLLRMNYFGLRGWRDSASLPVPVIEDHSHAPLGEWARKSNADWCVASLRKTLPVAEGGALWSPKGHPLPTTPELTRENQSLASLRWEAMREKSDYLSGKIIEKSSFRNKFLATEDSFESLAPSRIDDESLHVLDRFDFQSWFRRKQENWQVLSTIKSDRFKTLVSEPGGEHFSFTILCDTALTRDKLRARLIERCVYPAVLWPLPDECPPAARDMSSRMLSIHCDARYSLSDMERLKNIIEEAASNV